MTDTAVMPLTTLTQLAKLGKYQTYLKQIEILRNHRTIVLQNVYSKHLTSVITVRNGQHVIN